MKPSLLFFGFLICAMFAAAILGLFYVEPPPSAREPLLILVGSLAAAFGGVVNYLFGSSAGSARKTDALERMAQGGGA